MSLWIVCILPAILAGAAGLRLIRLQKELRLMRTRLLDRANFDTLPQSSPNFRLTLRTTDEGLTGLAASINLVLDRLQEAESRTREAENLHKRLVSNISHDLRTPLTSVLGYLEALLADDRLTEADRREFLTIAKQKADSMYKLLESFFQLSKLEAGDTELTPVPVEMNKLVTETALGLYPDFQRLSITPVISLYSEHKLYAQGDPVAIERILGNLLSNSLKYGYAGGEIGLSLGKKGDKILLEVWDNGPGIPSSELDKIFERMYRMEPARSPRQSGSGLGLTIARHLAEQMGGSLTAASQPGSRTSFILSLPSAAAPRSAAVKQNVRNS